MEPSDYKHVALGLSFFKHISDGFEMKRQALLADYPEGAEDPDEYIADNIFWVPQEARWSHLQANAKQTEVIHQWETRCSFEAVDYAPFEWVDWFNNHRLHEPIGNTPPTEAEANLYAALETEAMAA